MPIFVYFCSLSLYRILARNDMKYTYDVNDFIAIGQEVVKMAEKTGYCFLCDSATKEHSTDCILSTRLKEINGVSIEDINKAKETLKAVGIDIVALKSKNDIKTNYGKMFGAAVGDICASPKKELIAKKEIWKIGL